MHRSLSIDDVLQSPDLPTLPAVALQVLTMARDPNAAVDQIASIIQNDQALALKVMRSINSPLYGLSEKCTTVQRAVMFLGLDAVRVLALSFSLTSAIDGGHNDDDPVTFDFRSYWRRAVFSAAAARNLAARTKSWDPDEALLAALLQDIGMIAIYDAIDDIYLQIVDVAGDDHRSLRRHEQRSLRFNHAMVGARLLQRWNMPESLVAAAWFHESPDDADAAHQPLVRTVYTATLAAIAMSARMPATALEEFRIRLAQWFGLDGAAAGELLYRTASDAHHLSRLLELDTGEQPDAQQLLDEARILRSTLEQSQHAA